MLTLFVALLLSSNLSFAQSFPPAPPGFYTMTPAKKRLQSPKGAEQDAPPKTTRISSTFTTKSFFVVPGSDLVITRITKTETNVTLNWQGSGNIQVQESQGDGTWTDAGMPTTNGFQTVTATAPQAFYRLKVIPEEPPPMPQPPGTPLWSVPMIGSAFGKNVRVTAIATDSSSNVFSCGTYLSFVNFGGTWMTNYSPNIQSWVAKYNAAGALQWVTGFTNGTGLSLPSGIAANSDAVYVSGYLTVTNSINGVILASAGFEDAFLLKVTSDGSMAWVKRFGGTRSDYGRTVVIDQSGNPVLVGNFSDTASFGGTSLVSHGGMDLFFARVDKETGEAIEAVGYGSTGDEIPSSVAADTSGNLFVGGNFTGTCDFGGGLTTSASAGDLWIGKYGPDFSHQWSKRFGSSGFNYGNGVTVDKYGRAILTGSFQGAIDFGGGPRTPSFGSAIFFARFNSDGSHSLDRMFGGTSGGSDSGRSVSTDSDGNIYLTGTLVSSAPFDSIFLLGATPDVFITKMDGSGSVQWAKRYGDSSFVDEGYGISANGNLFLGGYFNGSINFGSAGSWSGPFSCQCGFLTRFER